MVHATSPTAEDVLGQHVVGNSACSFDQKGLEQTGILEESELRAELGVEINVGHVSSGTVDLLRTQASHLSSSTDNREIHTSSQTAATWAAQTLEIGDGVDQQGGLDTGRAQTLVSTAQPDASKHSTPTSTVPSLSSGLED